MADLAITNVVLAQQVPSKSFVVGETVSAFDVVYRNADGKFYRASAAAEASSQAVYLAMTGGNADEYILGIEMVSGLVVGLTGPTLVVGDRYVVSANAGKIAPRADLVTGAFLTELFLGESASQARFDVNKSGIQIP